MRLVLVASLLILSTPAIAAEADQPQAEKPVKEKKICKTGAARSQSRLRPKVCKTAKQWGEAQPETGASLSDLQRASGN